MWRIKEIPEQHTCMRPRQSPYHRNLDSSLVTGSIKEQIAYDPSVSVPILMAQVRSKYGYQVRYHTVWRAKQTVLDKTFGEYDRSYNDLLLWINAMRKYVPGSIFILEEADSKDEMGNIVRGEKVFRRLFWTFHQCQHVFRTGCKSFLQIDATFLYGKYKEKLLVAVSQDGDRNIVPIAYAIVEEETIDAWGFFMRNLRKYIARDMQDVALISDRHTSIISAAQNEENGWCPPLGYHMYCLRHVASNFYKMYRSLDKYYEVYAMGKNLILFYILN
jgi:MULE transposase domain